MSDCTDGFEITAIAISLQPHEQRICTLLDACCKEFSDGDCDTCRGADRCESYISSKIVRGVLRVTPEEVANMLIQFRGA